MHSEALTRIKKLSMTILNGGVVLDGNFKFDEENLKKLFVIVLKEKSQWIHEGDVNRIFYMCAYDSLFKAIETPENFSGKLVDIFEENAIDLLCSEILECYESIPRVYDIYVPLLRVGIELVESIELSENITLEYREDINLLTGKILTEEEVSFSQNRSNVFLKFKIHGYWNGNKNPTLNVVLIQLKIIIQQGIYRDLFTIRQGGILKNALKTDRYHHKIPRCTVHGFERGSGLSQPSASYDLDYDLAELMSSLVLKIEHESPLSAVEPNVLSRTIRRSLRVPVNLIESSLPEAKNVKMSIQWCFDSIVNKDNAMSFLQICIGLESILGETNSHEPLTTILSERCAYLLGESVKERNSIKSKFREIYIERGKLVHGVDYSDSADSELLKLYGRWLLEAAIAEEMKLLGLNNSRLSSG